jgi:hypothetical protein
MSYPTLANETIVERKGEDALNRKAHVAVAEDDPGTEPETESVEPEVAPEEPVPEDLGQNGEEQA